MGSSGTSRTCPLVLHFSQSFLIRSKIVCNILTEIYPSTLAVKPAAHERYLLSKNSLVSVGVSKIPRVGIFGTRDEKLSKFRRTREELAYVNSSAGLISSSEVHKKPLRLILPSGCLYGGKPARVPDLARFAEMILSPVYMKL